MFGIPCHAYREDGIVVVRVRVRVCNCVTVCDLFLRVEWLADFLVYSEPFFVELLCMYLFCFRPFAVEETRVIGSNALVCRDPIFLWVLSLSLLSLILRCNFVMS